MARIYSHEKTKLAFDGTPEAKVHDHRTGKPHLDPQAPARGLPKGHPGNVRSVLDHGINEVSDNEHALLAQDVNFQRMLDDGVLVFMDEDGKAIDPPEAPEYTPPAEAAKSEQYPPRDEPLVSEAAHNAGGETLPEGGKTPTGSEIPGGPADPLANGGADPVSKEVSDYFGLNGDERAAMYPALTPEAKAKVDADPRSKANAPAPGARK
jgi:hypothetical protein